MKKLIDLYAYTLNEKGDPLFLVLKRSEKKIYAGQWRMIGGKVKPGEKSWQAALRELKEETGLIPRKLWAVPTINHFYEPQSDQIHLIPVFAAQVDAEADITLDHEHIQSKWFKMDEINKIVQWPEQRRIISTIHSILSTSNRQIQPEWLIDF